MGGAASCSACDLLRRLPEKAVDDGQVGAENAPERFEAG